MEKAQLTPEASEALGQVYAFLLRRRRERLAGQTHETADAETRPGSPAPAAEPPDLGGTSEIVASTVELSTDRNGNHE